MKCTYLGTPISTILSVADCGENAPDTIIDHVQVGEPEDINKCTAPPRDYDTTEEDRNEYCNSGIKFEKCPRYKDGIKLEKRR